MFEPASILGMVIGLVVIGGATYLLVRGHIARERDEAEMAGDADAPPPRSERARDR